MEFNAQVTRANEITASWNSGVAQFLAEFYLVATAFVMVGIPHPAAWVRPVWAHFSYQDRRKMTDT
jgi:hypothetical protein